MKRFSLLSIAVLAFAVACADSTAPANSLTPPRSALLSSDPGNSPPPPVDAFITGDAGGVAFTADGTYFSNEESIAAAIALGTLKVSSAEEKSHAWVQLNDDPNNPLVDVSSAAMIKRQGDRLTGAGTFTVTRDVDIFVIRIDQVTSFDSFPDCPTASRCGGVTFLASISTNGGAFVPNQTGRMQIFNDEFLECGPECVCATCEFQ